MIDRSAIRNAGTGIFAIFSYLILYLPQFGEKISDLHCLLAYENLLILVPGVIGLPVFGLLIYQTTVALWGWFLYRDEARKIIGEHYPWYCGPNQQTVRPEKWLRQQWTNLTTTLLSWWQPRNWWFRWAIGTKHIRSFYWDPVFALDYYGEDPKGLIEWARRKRDSQMFCLNMLTAMFIALVGGYFANWLYGHRVCPSWRGVVCLAVLVVIFVRSLFYHKMLADHAEVVWAKRFLEKRKRNPRGTDEASICAHMRF